MSIKDIKLQRHLAPVSFPYYDDAAQDSMLRDYAKDPGKFSFQIPVGFLDCMRHFSSLDTPFLALVGDKGRTTLVDFHSTDSELVLHDGCFSF